MRVLLFFFERVGNRYRLDLMSVMHIFGVKRFAACFEGAGYDDAVVKAVVVFVHDSGGETVEVWGWRRILRRVCRPERQQRIPQLRFQLSKRYSEFSRQPSQCLLNDLIVDAAVLHFERTANQARRFFFLFWFIVMMEIDRNVGVQKMLNAHSLLPM